VEETTKINMCFNAKKCADDMSLVTLKTPPLNSDNWSR